MITLTFSDLKKINVLLYVMNQGVNNLINILKVIYYANKDHLEQYGREVVDDQYRAMEYGPVPSSIYDILKLASNRGRYKNYQSFTEFFNSNESGRIFTPNSAPRTEFLSDSDLSVLDKAIEKYGNLSFDELQNEVKKDPAYNSSEENEEISFKKLLVKLPNFEELREYLEIEL